MKDFKARLAESEGRSAKLAERNLELERELQEKENKYLELYEEHNILHEDMLELQEQLEEAGLFGDGLGDDGFENEGKSSSKAAKIPGGKAMVKIFKKLKRHKKGKT